MTLGGRPYVCFNTMTKRNEFLFVKSGFADSHDQQFEMQTTAMGPSSSALVPGAAAAVTREREVATGPTTPALITGAKEAGRAEKGARGKQGSNPTASAPPAKKPKTTKGDNPENDTDANAKKAKLQQRKKDLSDLMKLRGRMASACAKANDVVGMVTTQPGMRRLNTPAFLEAITTAKNKIEQFKNSSAFYRALSIQEDFPQYAKRVFSDEDMDSEMPRRAQLAADVTNLELETEFIMETYNAYNAKIVSQGQ